MLRSSDPVPENFQIRCDLKPGDMGLVIYLHGLVYAREYSYDHTFEAYVAGGLTEFAHHYHPGRDRLWIAEKEGQIIGCIGIVSHLPEEAQLRYFLVHPDCRNLGLGRTLLEEALRFSEQAGYEKIFLWTLQHLSAAIHLYRSAGFIKTEEKTHFLWGKTITEERYDLMIYGIA
jgi:ribosomal protein S18 acetylase RimI-like enzyme